MSENYSVVIFLFGALRIGLGPNIKVEDHSVMSMGAVSWLLVKKFGCEGEREVP